MRIGVDLGGTKIECVVLDDGGAVLARRRVPTPRGSYDGTLQAIRELIETCEAEADPGPGGPRARGGRSSIGIGIPGAISPATGLAKNANSIWLNGRPLREDLEALLGRPVRLANDANCFALSEATDGAGAGARTVFGVIIGTGTGGGIVVDGKVLTGPNAVAGEWGHNPLPWPTGDETPGPPCYCGRSGCIETFLSGPGLVRDFLGGGNPGGAGETGPPHSENTERTRSIAVDRPAPPRLDAAAVVALAAGGDPEAGAALRRYTERMSRALASVINLLDPDVIVLGGGMSNVLSLYKDVPPLWGRWIFSDGVSTPLLRARHGDSSGVRGAAWLWAPGE